MKLSMGSNYDLYVCLGGPSVKCGREKEQNPRQAHLGSSSLDFAPIPAAPFGCSLISTSMGRNPLQAAAIEGNTELTRILLDAGAEVNAHRTHGGQFWHYDLQNHP